jgi:hypothetical protein
MSDNHDQAMEDFRSEMRALHVRHDQTMAYVRMLAEAIISANEHAKRGLDEQEKTLLHRLEVIETATKEDMAFRLDVAALRYDVRRRRERLDALEARMTDLEARAILWFRGQLEADR